MQQYDFKEQYISGLAGEWVMEKYHLPFYEIEKTGKRGEKAGIDFIFSRGEEKQWLVEVKTDFKSQIYGNVIMEIVSVDRTNKPGWAYTSTCDYLLYYLWHTNEVLYFQMGEIKNNIDAWKEDYPVRPIKNDGFNTIGVKLPVTVAKQHSRWIRNQVDPYWMKKNYKKWFENNKDNDR